VDYTEGQLKLIYVVVRSSHCVLKMRHDVT
jgi:hypothetical protein